MPHKLSISKRLHLIASMIDKGSIIADVGCDHALLDIYLSKNGLVKKAIACDVAPGPLKEAIKNVSLSNVFNIDVRLGDGLDAINKEDNVNTIVISGLGYQKILDILRIGQEKLNGVDTVIIQSNTGYDKIRRALNKMGYYVKDEALVKERDIIYVVIKFQKGYIKHNKKEIYFGPVLLENKNALFLELVQKEIYKNTKIIKSLPKRRIIKRVSLKIRNLLLKKEIQNFK